MDKHIDNKNLYYLGKVDLEAQGSSPIASDKIVITPTVLYSFLDKDLNIERDEKDGHIINDMDLKLIEGLNSNENLSWADLGIYILMVREDNAYFLADIYVSLSGNFLIRIEGDDTPLRDINPNNFPEGTKLIRFDIAVREGKIVEIHNLYYVFGATPEDFKELKELEKPLELMGLKEIRFCKLEYIKESDIDPME